MTRSSPQAAGVRRRSVLRRAVCAATVCLAAATLVARAEARRSLEAVTLGTSKVRVDGLLREWPAKLDPLSDVIGGSPSPGDPSASGVIGYDDKNLYVVFKIKDRKLVRTTSFGDEEDYAALDIGFPLPGKAYKAYTVRLYAGEIGKSAGAVKIGETAVTGAKLVEAPSDGGYTIEASVPWTAFPEARRARVGLKAALRYADTDASARPKNVIGTGSGSGASLPWLWLEAEQGILRNLVRKKGLPESPSRFAVGDVAGDDRLEGVGIYGGYITMAGSGYREGKEFFFQDLAVPDASYVSRLDVADFTGDGKDDILLVKKIPATPRAGDKDKASEKAARDKKEDFREVLQVLRVSSGDNPYVAFQQEVGVITKKGELHNEITLKRNGSKTDIVLSTGKLTGFDAATYDEPAPEDMDSALFPWGSIKTRTFSWDGKTFTSPASEIPEARQPRALPAGPSAAAAPAQTSLPPPPPPPSAEELLDKVYSLYRHDRKAGAKKPRFDFVTDVAGDKTKERVLVHDKDIVVFGKNFKEGTSYAYITIGVENPSDIEDATARDVTGDGKAEILVRGVLHAKASKQLGGGVVDRHALFVYEVSEAGLRRIFGAETGRSVGDSSIVAGLKLVPKSIELSRGKATGWSEATYPFPVDKTPYGGLEPLIVPWSDPPSKRYRYDGSTFVAE
jgi:hypothetical protein